MALLARALRTGTHFPYKGDANYFSINATQDARKRDLDYETPFRRWRRSPAIWRSIPIGSRSRSWLEATPFRSAKVHLFVMPGLSGIHVFSNCLEANTWMPGQARHDELAGRAQPRASYPEDRKAQDQEDRKITTKT